jgi:hypothetical protein
MLIFKDHYKPACWDHVEDVASGPFNCAHTIVLSYIKEHKQ